MGAGHRAALAAMVTCACSGAPPPPSTPTQVSGGRFGVHGMVVFGRDHTFMSHIPMLHPPHDAQLVLEVELAPPPPPPASAGELRTFEPQPFSLDDLRAGKLGAFVGDLYRGNFEAGGVKLAADVRATVKRVLLDAPLDGRDGAAGADYVVVGTPGDVYGIHVLRSRADVDRVVALGGRTPAAPGSVVRDDALAGAVELSCLVPPDYAEACGATR